MRILKLLASAAVAAGVMAMPATSAMAQEFPDRPLTLIIPLGAGGSHDLNARVITSVLPEQLGQPVLVQLMPGAGGQTGTTAAAEAEADGYTMIFTHNYIDQLQQHVARLPYTPNEDFVAVARVNTAQPVLVVREDSEFDSFEEFVTHGQANPGELRFGHSGNWGAFMTPGLALLQEAGVQATLIPYQGGGPALQALLAGDTDFTFAFPSVLAGQPLKALVQVGENAVVDGVPTTSELGYDGVSDIGVMHRVVLAPAGVPEERLQVLRDAFAAITESRTYQNLLGRMGENTDFMSGEDYEAVRRAQSEQYEALVASFQQ